MSKGKNLLGEFRKELLEEWQKASALLPYEVYAEYRASPFRVLSPVIDVENHKKIVVSGRAVGKSTTITRYMEQMFYGMHSQRIKYQRELGTDLNKDVVISGTTILPPDLALERMASRKATVLLNEMEQGTKGASARLRRLYFDDRYPLDEATEKLVQAALTLEDL